MRHAVVSVQFALCVIYSLVSNVALAPSGNQDKTHVLMSDFTNAFRAFDLDGDGKITKEEFAIGMRALGEELTAEEIQDMVTFADKNNDGVIDFNEFSAVMSASVDESLRESFDLIDKDGDGLLSSGELAFAMKSIAEDLSDGEIDAMVQEADSDKDGFVNFEEYVVAMTKRGTSRNFNMESETGDHAKID